MKILQVLPDITVGGPSYTVTELTRALSRVGNEVQLHVAKGNLEGLSDIDIRSYKVLKWPFIKQLGFAFGEYKALKKECYTAQIIQTNSLWMYPNFITEFARRSSNTKSVIMPRGTLSEYALSISSWKKKLVSYLGQGSALRNADLFIATCKMEYQDIRRYGLKAPVAIIPNGIHIPKLPTKVEKKKRVVFLSRIHKKKGVDILLDAWRKIENKPEFAKWNLSIVGPLNDYACLMIDKAKSIDCKNVDFPGEMSGEAKFQYLAESSLFVLPTHSENFGIAVAEALACEIPAICTTGAPWEGLVKNDCGKWIDLSEDNLIQSLEELMSMPVEQLHKMGLNGKAWMERDFSWNEIAYKSTLAFEWLMQPDLFPKPDFVYTD